MKSFQQIYILCSSSLYRSYPLLVRRGQFPRGRFSSVRKKP